MRKFIVEIPDDLLDEIKTYLEEDLGESFVPDDHTAVFKKLLEEGTMAVIIPDMDRLKEVDVIHIEE